MAEPLETCEITDPAVWKLLSDPLRRSILHAFSREPQTTKQVSQALGIKSNKLYHHVDLLVSSGLLKLIETKQKRGTTEKYLQAVARRFVVKPAPIGDAHAGAEVVSGLVSDLAQELEAGRFEPDGPRTLGVKGHLRLTPEGLTLFQEKIEELLQEMGEPDEGARYSFTLLAFPLKPGN